MEYGKDVIIHPISLTSFHWCAACGRLRDEVDSKCPASDRMLRTHSEKVRELHHLSLYKWQQQPQPQKITPHVYLELQSDMLSCLRHILLPLGPKGNGKIVIRGSTTRKKSCKKITAISFLMWHWIWFRAEGAFRSPKCSLLERVNVCSWMCVYVAIYLYKDNIMHSGIYFPFVFLHAVTD